MNVPTTILSIGIAWIVAAVVGGAFKPFRIEVPILTSRFCRIALAMLVGLSSCTPLLGGPVMVTSAQPSGESLYQQSGSEFTVHRDGRRLPGRQKKPPNDQSVDVAVVEFNDDGSFVNADQLNAALRCITDAREDNPNGALVMVFIHGWHHGARWDDKHFDGFRKSLMGLALREAERYGAWGASGRRVVGVYIGWHGENTGSLLHWINENLTFWNRYATAEQIGQGAALKLTIREIVKAAKGPLDPNKGGIPLNDSPLIMIGHSMGALMFETAFLTLLRDPESGLMESHPVRPMSVTRVERNGRSVTFPDLILLLNSAAKSTIAKTIIRQFLEERLRKIVTYEGRTYESPLLISVTSTSDWATKFGFRVGKPLSKTDGHDSSLVSHQLTRELQGARCTPKPSKHLAVSFEQVWHCLREPAIKDQMLVSIPIDLPQKGEEEKEQKSNCHERYRLEPAETRKQEGPFWLFQVPPDIIDGHNGIYENARSNLLVMALVQMSGTIMSLAEKWADVFEPDEGRCALTEE